MPAVNPSKTHPADLRALEFRGRRVHMIGIGGCGMSGIANMLVQHGAIVSGSDAVSSQATAQLLDAGLEVFIGHRYEQLPRNPDLIIASAAIPESNPELLAARAVGKTVLKYADVLGLLMKNTAGIAIAGAHGKSTATAMASYVLKLAGADPSYVIGAEVPQLAAAALRAVAGASSLKRASTIAPS